MGNTILTNDDILNIITLHHIYNYSSEDIALTLKLELKAIQALMKPMNNKESYFLTAKDKNMFPVHNL